MLSAYQYGITKHKGCYWKIGEKADKEDRILEGA
jgi:hypothetical protein